MHTMIRWVRTLDFPIGIRMPQFHYWLLSFVLASTVIFALYIGFCLFIVSSSLNTIRMDYESTPAASGLSAERIRFKSAWDGIPLTGWLLPASGKRAVVMVH